MASSSSFRRLVNGSSLFITSRTNSSQMRSNHSRAQSVTAGAQSVSSERPLRQFVSGKGKSAGRNSAGRITIFHRGGGAKRLQRTVDLKRNTSSVGVVERIEYDPNRTSRIAVVRWVEGAETDHHEKINTVENLAPPTRKFSPAMSVKGQFSFSSLPRMQEERKVVSVGSKTDHVVVGLPKGIVHRLKDDAEDNESLALDEIKKWDKDSIAWAHKMKRKAAISWQSVRGHKMLGLVGVACQNGSKLNSKTVDKQKRYGKFTKDCAPVTYILATQGMEAGKMVMNRESSKRSNDELLHRY
ncbi:hypothetical protein L1987_81696 [Smallanthus sonchifolius]|uniref:Uncharacterized protein n=1 Tax=Smallanthus sonchifolius TaxID=185202 RepID=A0ACB8YSE9_9ASTR|nr:hypothetical protein L1987_81696 [Smallanthus sonchifolius]